MSERLNGRALRSVLDRKLGRHWHDAALIGLLALLFLFARYWYSRRFGLYEDDWTIIPAAGQRSFGELLVFCWNYFIHMYGHARPLSDIYIYLLSFVGWKLAGMWGLYWLGFAVQVTNIGLFYALLVRLSGRRMAVMTCIAYVLYSADTTQIFLTHSLGVHPSITLLLLSLHCFISPRLGFWRWPAAYVLAFVILFSYETPFPIFFAAPLLLWPWNRRWFTRAALHVVLVGLMLAGVLVFRSWIGDDRVAGTGVGSLLLQAADRVVRGPLVSLGSYLIRSRVALKNIHTLGVAAFGLLGAGLAALALFVENEQPSRPFSAGLRQAGRLAAVGLAMLLLAYPLTLTVDPATMFGRGTRAHTAAGLGCAVFLGAVGLAALEVLGRRAWAGKLLIALIAAPLAGFGFMVQTDFVRGWQMQRTFWTDLVFTVQDFSDGDVILVEPGIFPQDTDFIEANTWNMPRVLEQLVHFPDGWQNPPKVYRLMLGWENRILSGDGSLTLDGGTVYAPGSLYQQVNPARAIFILNDNGQMQRAGGRLSFNGEALQVKPGGPAAGLPVNEFLYPYVILSENLEEK